ncbi:GntR family transcriptional regulator [Georgenia subflava]|uniref:FCD domain-containing protein n=1 Tax=Georgenia subflava TaxID=1622177 RepID=A0A6N7EIR9_9MICO|nr:GntR family transcriptional regulator [Georgenia subflava]MPV36908.1 FCD domain-containing protein [Georgenia subflava]
MSTSSQLFDLAEAGTGIQRTLAERVAVELHRAILRGDFEAGAWLRIQEIAEHYETSAMPVREALRRLGALGLVEVVPHRGARVAELSVADLEDTYATRLALEPIVVAAAARRFTSGQAAEAGRALDRHEELLDAREIDAARAAHTEFHFLLYRASGSRWLLRAIDPVWQNSERYRFAAPRDRDAQERSHAEHSEILRACVEHDPEAAAEAMMRHLNGAMERMRHAMTS